MLSAALLPCPWTSGLKAPRVYHTCGPTVCADKEAHAHADAYTQPHTREPRHTRRHALTIAKDTYQFSLGWLVGWYTMLWGRIIEVKIGWPRTKPAPSVWGEAAGFEDCTVTAP